ncbi:hypothetical protein [Scandinavium manionii]|uniref:hypothetical protein n=1 Tax=Scandinavium manionii TaxID=2926520 RepID=UPI00216545F4|nr:hypothetical protein [Scandinavium manionii]MCS2166562.1 hypothetical protein [Scandinavium manionii]
MNVLKSMVLVPVLFLSLTAHATNGKLFNSTEIQANCDGGYTVGIKISSYLAQQAHNGIVDKVKTVLVHNGDIVVSINETDNDYVTNSYDEKGQEVAGYLLGLPDAESMQENQITQWSFIITTNFEGGKTYRLVPGRSYIPNDYKKLPIPLVIDCKIKKEEYLGMDKAKTWE